jgi:alpha-tubulin suppressor-like RCC1 family protein
LGFRSSSPRRLALLVLLGATLRCSDLTLPSEGLPASLVVEGGADQRGEVGTFLSESLRVRVTDLKGRPAEDVGVAFVVVDGASGSHPAADTVRTDSDGRATYRWLLGDRAGPQALEAVVNSARGAELTARFVADAYAGPADTLFALSGDRQSAVVGTTLALPLTIGVADRFGNPVAAQRIHWQASGDGWLSDTATFSGVDGSGQVTWRLGSTAGEQVIEASVAGLAGSPVRFVATAGAGVPAAVRRVAGDGQTAPVGTKLATAVAAQLVDQFGNGIPGQHLNWIVTAGGGLPDPPTGTTDSTGRVATSWTLGPTAGTQGLSAVVGGLAPVVFSALATPEVPATIQAVSATSLAGIAGQAVTPPPSVRVTDALGNAVPGLAVTFAVRGAGGTVSNGTSQGSSVLISTDLAGTATLAAWTLGAVAGTDTLEARASGPAGPLAGSPVRFIAVGLTGSAARLHFVQQPSTTPAGQPITPAVTVAVQDSNGNLVPNYSGTVTISLGTFPAGATLGGTSTASVLGGIASFPALILTTVGTGYTLLATAGSGTATATSTPFSVVPGSGARLAIVTQPYDTGTSGVRLLRQPVIRLQDGFGNPIQQAGVVVIAAIGTGGGTLAGTPSVPTNATGVASFTDLAISGTVGPRTLTFTSPGAQAVNSAPIMVLAGPPAAVVAAAGDGQIATIGTVVAVAPAVRVTDLAGNGVQGVAVTFAVTLGGGSVTGPAAVTDAGGIATVGSWRLGPLKGANTLTATPAAPVGASVTLTATGRFAFRMLRGGAEFSCGVSTANQAYCWGRGNRGQLGDGGVTDRLTPVAVAGGRSFQTIGLGDTHACALTDSGAAYCWGANTNDQLGDGTATDRSSPVAVAGGLAFISIEAGDAHTCGLTAAGAAYCWGANSTGQLGDGTTTMRATPVPVTGGHSFASLALGTGFSCGRTVAGVIYCWGINKNGQLGNGNQANQSIPVATGGTGWAALTAGEEFACALNGAGAASCWGRNDKGQLGDGTKTNRKAPTAVSGALAFTQFDAGGKHVCGLSSAGAAFCWGVNADGELGDGTTTDRPVPTAVIGGQLPGAVAVGGLHSLALTPLGSGLGWGRDQNGQLGTGTITDKTAPTPVIEP